VDDYLTNLLYTQAIQRYPLPARYRPLIRKIQLSSPDEATYIRRIEALMDEEPELARIFALRSALVESAAAHLENGDTYDPDSDTWHPRPQGPT
jgi:hypothetical protein